VISKHTMLATLPACKHHLPRHRATAARQQLHPLLGSVRHSPITAAPEQHNH
jgi:hypothetical protein